MLNPGQDIVACNGGLQTAHACAERRTFKTCRDRSADSRANAAESNRACAKFRDQAAICGYLRDRADNSSDDRRNSHQTSLLE